MSFSEFRKRKWVRFASNKYVLILILFIVWMFVFDTNSYFIHNELNNDINALEENKEFYQKEIDHDKKFIEKMDDSDEVERYGREKYYLKKENEDIYIIQNEDSLNNTKKEEKR